MVEVGFKPLRVMRLWTGFLLEKQPETALRWILTRTS